jgi:hypothetical protein
MMGHRAKLAGGDEWDAFTRGKRFHFWHAGERRRLKRKFAKRQRAQVILSVLYSINGKSDQNRDEFFNDFKYACWLHTHRKTES